MTKDGYIWNCGGADRLVCRLYSCGSSSCQAKVFCAETLEVLAKYVLKLGLPVFDFY